MNPIKVLVVDDSALVRQILSEGLAKDPMIEVVGTAPDPFVARDKILELRPDVMTLDVEMPRMDGVEFLRRLMPQYPLPVVMVSSLTERGGELTMQALNAGAIDFVCKPKSGLGQQLVGMMAELCEKVKFASKANIKAIKKPTNQSNPVKQQYSLSETTDKVILIGASTGGTQAIREVLLQMPHDIEGIVIVQHMPPGFTKKFAEMMNDDCQIAVKEAVDGERVLKGQAIIAQGDKHLKIVRQGGHYCVYLTNEDKVSRHRPSVDVLFRSGAKYLGKNAVGIILTGMGRDGAEGMLELKKAGGRTMAQDEKTSVVFGMPKEAFKNGGAECLVPLDQVVPKTLKYLRSMR